MDRAKETRNGATLWGVFRWNVAWIAILGTGVLRAQDLPEFDFTRSEIAREWGDPHHISVLRPIPEGLEIEISGSDPYLFGPARDYPEERLLWLVLRMKADSSGMGEVFYFVEHPDPKNSVRFHVPGGGWNEVRVRMPALGPAHRLRIDPPGVSGQVVLAGIRFEKRVVLPEPSWPEWEAPRPGAEPVLHAGDLELVRGALETPFAFELRVRGRSVAFGHPRPRIAWLDGEKVEWVDLAAGSIECAAPDGDSFQIAARALDGGGAEWTWRQMFRNGSDGAIRAETRVSVSRDRAVLFLPMHLLLAGEQSFGSNKEQGIFAGLEYLADEPSRSEADIEGPEANRRVPAAHKITFPLMAIQADGRYAGLIWEDPATFSALFDSPDRTFGSDGHVMGVIYPESDGANREEGSLFPGAGRRLEAGREVVARAWLIGGPAESAVAAVQKFVQLRGWPDLPDTGLDFEGYVSIASKGWLRSKCREGDRYRHAVWPGFEARPAADAAVFQSWLARHSTGPVREALRGASAQAISAVPSRDFYHSAIGHIRVPVAPLVFGAVGEAVEAARGSGRARLGQFSPDGSVPYRRRAGGPDYGRTHFAEEANGLTAQAVAVLLEAAAFCGDRELIEEGLVRLLALEKYRHMVPRGAQTWEIPLHTPDILASAHLVRAFTLGHELTGEPAFLERAIEWAWTGVPFVYLHNPAGKPIGPYSTIAVLGATNWQAPVWFGRPVQWCGLVYADALYRLARHDPAGPWKHLADGITSAGIQHSWPAEDADRVGLLPDFFELREQVRAGPAINPGTVGACAVRLYDRRPLCDFRAFRKAGLRVHAPGEIVPDSETDRAISFTVRGWPEAPYFVLVNGLSDRPVIRVDGAAADADFDAAGGRAILRLTGESRVEIDAMDGDDGSGR